MTRTVRWGALGKVRLLDDADRQLRDEGMAPHRTYRRREQLEHLDLATVIKVSEAVSGEILLER